MKQQTGIMTGFIRGLLCSVVLLGVVTVAQAAPTIYTRTGTTDTANWSATGQWTPNTGYPGTDVGDTAVFGAATGTRVTMDIDTTVDSVIVTNTGSWTWRYNGTRTLTVTNLFRYASSGTSSFGYESSQNQSASIAGTGKVQIDAGTLIFVGTNNTYGGGTELNGGTLWSDYYRRGGRAPGTGPITIGATGGAAADAQLWMSAASKTFAMPITIRSGNAGRAVIGFNNLTGVAAGDSWLISLTGGITLQKDLTLANDFTCHGPFTQGQLNILTTGISGSGNVTKDGIGMVKLQAANSYAGTTTVRSGYLTLDSAANSNTGDILGQGGLLMVAADASLGNAANTLTLGDTGTFGGFGAYNTDPGFNRTITLAGNGGFLQSLYGGYYRQLGSGLITGPGKLILSAFSTKLANNNDYAGGTVIVEGFVDNVSGLADNNTLFGSGDVEVKFNSSLLLRGNNVASGKKILVSGSGTRSTGAQANLRLYAGVTTVPAIDPESSGILALNATSNAVFNSLVATNAPQLGNGYMTIASGGFTFGGASLQANLDNVYRLGALNGELILDAPLNGVLTGARSLEVGQPLTANTSFGSIYRAGLVRTFDANDYSGTTTVYQQSQLRGTAQTPADQSPFGHTNGAVTLMGGTLYLDSVSGGQPVTKGALTVDGFGQVSLSSSHVGNQLQFASLNRVGNSVLYVSGPGTTLGSPQAKVLIASGLPATVNNMLPPWLLNPAGGFMNYTVDGFTNVVYTHTSLAAVDSSSLVNLAGGSAVAGTKNVHALRTAGALTGGLTDSLVIGSGGLILASASTHTAPIAFGSAEGVIFDTGVNNILSGKLTGSGGVTKVGSGLLTLNADNSATLSGPVTVNQGTLRLGVVGALATNSLITLNGGAFEANVAQTVTNALVLGKLGGMLGADTAKTLYFAGSITGGAGTGPLTLYATGNAYMELAGINSYPGGTLVSRNVAVRVSVQPQSSLGTGDVTVDGGGSANPASTLILQGDANISSGARVLLANSGSKIMFASANPRIGSLEGNGFVLLGVFAFGAGQTGHTRLTVGGNDQNTEFFGRIIDTSSCLVAGGLAYNQLVKVGSGNLTLWGENTCKGGTIISNGTLTVNNVINPAGWVTIASQGTLDGIGTVGPVTNLGGTVSGSVRMPSLVLGSGSKVGVTLNGGTAVSQYSQLSVQGPVNLNGSTLQLTLGFAPAVGQSFTILNGASVTGQFANGSMINASYGGKAYAFSITTVGNTVVLTVMPQGTIITIK
jgi:fibronectin-binding autotransporter adhesin